MRYLLLSITLLLPGCAELLQQSEADKNKRIEAYASALKTQCANMGYAYYSRENDQCAMALHQQKEQARQQAATNQMMIGAQLLSNSGPKPLSRPLVTCDSTPTGGGRYQTDCY